MKVAILGASDRPDRFANKAMKKLESHGHQTYLVNPNLNKVEDRKVYGCLRDIEDDIHTLAMYVSSKISDRLVNDILSLKPERVIFNPGAENRGIYPKLEKNGILAEEACVLALLNTDRF